MRLFTIICMAAAMAAVGGEYTIDLPEENVNGRIVAVTGKQGAKVVKGEIIAFVEK